MEFTISTIINSSPSVIYEAWLDSEKHSAMTGGEAKVENGIGGHFTAWEGYISGENLALDENKRILQSWRTSEFSETDGDSTIELLFDVTSDGHTQIVLIHSNLPEDGEKYKQGWVEHYFEPMKKYFES